MISDIPHVRIVIGVCIAAVAGYAVFSVWAVFYSDDASLRGDVIGTWKSFAVAAFTFWLGSSSGGKTKATPAGTTADPLVVKGGGKHAAPVNITPVKKTDDT